jgi:hypothetical protein
MEILLEYLLFSTIQFASALCLTLALFRIQLKGNVPHVVLTSLILSQSSYIIREVANIPSLTAIIQSLVMIVLIWLMFRIHILYASIMVAISYFLLSIMEIIFVQIVVRTQVITMDELINNRSISLLYQIISSLLIFFICFVLFRKRIGFSFVPDNEKDRFVMRGLNLYLLLGVILVMFLLSVIYSLGFINPILSIGISILLLVMLLYLAVRKDLE